MQGYVFCFYRNEIRLNGVRILRIIIMQNKCNNIKMNGNENEIKFMNSMEILLILNKDVII